MRTDYSQHPTYESVEPFLIRSFSLPKISGYQASHYIDVAASYLREFTKHIDVVGEQSTINCTITLDPRERKIEIIPLEQRIVSCSMNKDKTDTELHSESMEFSKQHVELLLSKKKEKPYLVRLHRSERRATQSI